MGIYNSEYENYYNNMKRRGGVSYSYKGSNSKKEENFITRRIIRDLIGVLILFMLVLMCKGIKTPQAVAVYNYSKRIVNTNYDYKPLVEKIKGIDLSKIDLKNKLDINNINSDSTSPKVQWKFNDIKNKLVGWINKFKLEK